MNPEFSSAALAWLLTYALQSSVLLGLVWLITRSRRIPPMATDVLWKAALVGGVLTATLQQRFDVRPSGTVMLPRVAESAAPVADRTANPIVTPDAARLAASGSGRSARGSVRNAGPVETRPPGSTTPARPLSTKKYVVAA